MLMCKTELSEVTSSRVDVIYSFPFLLFHPADWSGILVYDAGSLTTTSVLQSPCNELIQTVIKHFLL